MSNDIGFVSNTVINMVHWTVRFVGGNTFILTSLDDFESDESNYVIGLHSTYILISIFFLTWFLFVVCAKCTAFEIPNFYSKYVGFVLILSIIFAVFGWLISFVTTVGIGNSIRTMEKNVVDIQRLMTDLEVDYRELMSGFVRLKANNIDTNNACDHAINTIPDYSGARYPYIQTLSKIISLENAFIDLQTFFEDVGTISHELVTEIDTRFSNWATLFNVFAALDIFSTVFLAILISVTASNAYFSGELNLIWMSRFTLLTVILNFAMAMVASSGGVYALLGSDFCYKSPDIQLNALLAKLNDELDICSVESPIRLICAIQTCQEGENMFSIERGMLDNVVQYFEEDVFSLASHINDLYTGEDMYGRTCIDGVNRTVGDFYIVDQLIIASTSRFDCKIVKALYQEMMHDSLCNNIVANFGTMWISLSTGLVSSMLIIAIFMLVDVESGNYDRLLT